MEANYLDIEALVQQARQQRSQAAGEIFAAGWDKCKKLFRTHLNGRGIVWRILPH